MNTMMNMKRVLSLLLVCLLVGCTGCMTTQSLNAAKVTNHRDENGDLVADEPHSGYYALVPFAFVGDVVTFPFQMIYFLVWWKDC